MASGLGLFICGEILDHIFGGNSAGNVYTPDANVYLALGTDAAPDYQTFTEVKDPSTSEDGYTRVTIANTTVNWDAHSDSTSTATKTSGGSGNNAFTFPANTGTSPGDDWGTVRSWCITTAETAAINGATNVLAFGELTTDKTITVGDIASFADGALTISIKAANS